MVCPSHITSLLHPHHNIYHVITITMNAELLTWLIFGPRGATVEQCCLSHAAVSFSPVVSSCHCSCVVFSLITLEQSKYFWYLFIMHHLQSYSLLPNKWTLCDFISIIQYKLQHLLCIRGSARIVFCHFGWLCSKILSKHYQSLDIFRSYSK